MVTAVALVAFGFVMGTALISDTAASSGSSTVLMPQQALQTPIPLDSPALVTDTERLFADIYNRVSPSVVSINVVATAGQDSPFSDSGLAFGSGSGFVIDQQGYIVTNNHVVDGAQDIEVNFFDGTIVRGEIVGLDPDSDLAVLRVDLPADRLHPVTFADSNQLVIGQTTLAIGSPFGQRWTLTSGIVSALDRTIEGLGRFSIGSVVQTDAAINPGNSGGVLLNLQGQVIGVNSQIISRSNSSSGIGFAIPSNLVQRVSRELIADGEVDYSYLGIVGGDVDLAMIEAASLPNNLRGVVIEQAEAGGPASAAGLRNASNFVNVNGLERPRSVDIVTAIDGIPVAGMSSLISYLASNTIPGQSVNLTVYRDSQQVVVPVVLGARP
ncbi:MAG: trypsin-like peptidase domain-containing protein [Burkholderiales bacterium]|nr:trypsin-like peptidase domain-containing protein [Anaerolineae bacterium]